VSEDPRIGLTVTHRRYIPYAHAHYAGDLVDGAYVLALFGDVATEVCIRTDGDEGLFASYSDVQFLAPVQAGDVVEATATVRRVGRRSRVLDFEARVVCRSRAGNPDAAAESNVAGGVAPASAAQVLHPPVIAVTASGTVVVPAAVDERPTFPDS
jgi:3-aminobutyryl-CoA ammonia-lyase